ncbi:hypothetical protein KC19_2G078000 [Ceratodon purpureus]|uniref:Uncharacterized protein n=1 Tax=Ceratodon purpureus TaxID=3225 RepID=A0A8T0IV74_CERPU|nr:hypothetical protein KC19_2G078000 [Ceratodon purpureus]
MDWMLHFLMYQIIFQIIFSNSLEGGRNQHDRSWRGLGFLRISNCHLLLVEFEKGLLRFKP